MKICFLAPASNYHTKKWCKWFTEHGHQVHVVSFINAPIDNTTAHYVNTGADVDSRDSQKLEYLLRAREVKKIVDEIKPDVINAHYATSYGTVAALSGLRNYILSVWGMDIYDFPKKGIIHKTMLKYSLSKASHIFSTSKVMAEEIAKYTSKYIDITPFGVDIALFNPDKRNRNDNAFVVGTIKALAPKYGIDYLLKAVAIIKKEYPAIPLQVRIAGSGPNEKEYKKLTEDLNISNIVKWLGFISQEKVASEWANMDLGIGVDPYYFTYEAEKIGIS